MISDGGANWPLFPRQLSIYFWLVIFANWGCGDASRIGRDANPGDSAAVRGTRIASPEISSREPSRLADSLPPHPSVPQWTISNAQIEIGRQDGERPYLFNNIVAAFLLENDRIVVADGGSKELRLFDKSGKHLKTFGRSGRGPGEFGSITKVLNLSGDSLLIQDARVGRLTVTGPDLTMAYELSRTQIATAASGTLIGRVGEDEYVFLLAPGVGPERPGYRRDTVSIVVQRLHALTRDTVMRIPSRERFHIADGPLAAEGPVTLTNPLGFRSVATVWGNQIIGGTGESAVLRVFNPESKAVKSILAHNRTAQPLTKAYLESYRNRLIAAGHSPEFFDLTQRLFSASENNLPEYSDLIVDDEGLLWVGSFHSSGVPPMSPERTWNVIDPGDRQVAVARTPEGFQVLDISRGYIVGCVTDSLGVERIRVLRLYRTRQPQ